MKNSINTIPYDIAAIILAYLRSEIDENGQQKLDVWLEEADSHMVSYVQMRQWPLSLLDSSGLPCYF